MAPFALKERAEARRPRGLVTEVVDSSAGSIREGQLQPGTKLPTESEIMSHFGVSRTVVREAISKLQASALAETRHGIGTFVLELRISLETETAGLAALRRTPDNLLAMKAALDAFQESIHQDSDAVPPDFQFHMEVAHSTGNRHFADLMTYLGTMIIPRTRVNSKTSRPLGPPCARICPIAVNVCKKATTCTRCNPEPTSNLK